MNSLFVTCSRGFEPLLQKELLQLGFSESSLKFGFRGVEIDHNEGKMPIMQSIYKINYASRLGIRVLQPLIRGNFMNRDRLYEAARSIPWHKYVPEGVTFAVESRVSDTSQFTNTMFTSLVVKDAIADVCRDHRGFRPNVDTENPQVRFNLFIHEGEGVISVDTSVCPLSKRGYRRRTITAPLQETLAAAILSIAEYSGEQDQILYDPCCGSGTFLIEAGMIAARIPSGFLRSSEYGFYHLPGFNPNEWQKVKSGLDARIRPVSKNQIFGTDMDSVAVEAANYNIKSFSGKILDNVVITQSKFQDFKPPVQPNLLVTNPPFGERLGSEDFQSLTRMYKSLGDFMKKQCAKPTRGFILTGDKILSKSVELKSKRRHILFNGGIESRLLEFDIY